MRKHSKRRPKPVLLPLGMKRLNLFEFPKHAALVALGQAWMTDDHLAELLSACDIALELARDEPAIFECALTGRQRLLDGLHSGDATFEKATDLDELRYAIGHVVNWITHQPNRAVHDAVIKRLKEIHGPETVS